MAKQKQPVEYIAERTLNEPIEAHGETLTVLRLRKPKGKDFKKISAMSMEKPFQMLLDFAALLAEVPPSALDELDHKDVQWVIETVGPFVPGYQQT